MSAPITGLPDIFVDGQAGLLDVALSPDYAQDGWIYLAFAEPNFRGNKAGTAVVRGKLRGDALVESNVVYTQEPKLSHGTHVGARLVFDDQGHLFVTQGDNRVGAATAQDWTSCRARSCASTPTARCRRTIRSCPARARAARSGRTATATCRVRPCIR